MRAQLPQALEQVKREARYEHLDLRVPAFSFSAERSLRTTLEALRIRTLFSDAAGLPGSLPSRCAPTS